MTNWSLEERPDDGVDDRLLELGDGRWERIGDDVDKEKMVKTEILWIPRS